MNRAILLLSLTLILPMSGCRGINFFERYPVTTVMGAGGAIATGVPTGVGLYPITAPIHLATSRRFKAWKPLAYGGVPFGVVGAVATGLPVFLIELPIRETYEALKPKPEFPEKRRRPRRRQWLAPKPPES